MEMIRVTSSFADGPVNFNPTGPVEDQTKKLISSTGRNLAALATGTMVCINKQCCKILKSGQ